MQDQLVVALAGFTQRTGDRDEDTIGIAARIERPVVQAGGAGLRAAVEQRDLVAVLAKPLG